MSFIKLILKNAFKKKFSAILSMIGIGVGITLIVALGSITAGITDSANNMFKESGYDFEIQGMKNNDTSTNSPMGMSNTNSIDAEWVNKIKGNNGIERDVGIYQAAYSYIKNQASKTYPQVSYIPIYGMNSSNVEFFKINMTNGTLFNDNDKEAVLGKGLAEKENKTIGDTFNINSTDYKITGIFENEYGYNNTFITSLKNVQEYVNDLDNVSSIYVKVKKGENVENVEKELEKEYGANITIIKSIKDMNGVGDMLGMMDLISLAISALSLFVGGIGILNTMMMSIYERTREIGVLKAVGWKNRRIIKMILGESLVLTITSAIFASIVGVVISKAIFYIASSQLNMTANLNPAFPLTLFIEAFLFAIVIGLLGGFYPAYKASKLPPTEALRYE